MKVPTRTSIGVAPNAQPLRPPSGAGGTPDAFGAGLAQSMAQLGGQTAALGAYISQQNEQKKRFDALTQFTQFQHDQRQALIDAQRNAPPGSNNLYEVAAENFRLGETAFLGSLDPELQEEFRARTAEIGAGLSLDAAKAQFEMNDKYFKDTLQVTFDQARTEVGQDPTALEMQREAVLEQIASSALPDAEKVAIARKVNAGLEAVAYREAQIARLREEAQGVGSDLDRAMTSLIDQGMPEAEAFSNIVGAQQALTETLGDLYNELPARVRAVLIEATVTDGLSKEVVEAVQQGDLDAIAAALRASGAETLGDLIENPEAGIDNDPAFANVPYEDRLALISDAERTVTAEINAAQQAASAANKSMINGLHVALYEGTAGQADIDQAKEAGILTDYEDIKKADDILAKRDEDLQLQRLAQEILTGQQVYRPGDDDHKKALDAMIGEQGLKALQNKDSEYAANILIPLIGKAQAVPSTVVEQLAGMARSLDADKAYWALDLMSQVEKTAPQAFSQFSADDRRNVDFWLARKDYVPQDEMMKAIRGPMDPAERNARIALRKVGQDLFTAQDGALRNFDAVSLFTGPKVLGLPLYNGWNGSPPTTKWVSQALNNDFRTLFLDNYELSGDVKTAQDAATTQLMRVWGTTSVGRDGAIMKYPPEKAYPTASGSYAWMEQQLFDEGLIEPAQPFELISDAQTEAEWGTGTPPSYLLTRIRDGVSEPVMATTSILDPANPEVPIVQSLGVPERVYFDFGPVQAAEEQLWREEQARTQELNDQNVVIQKGMKHELETGIEVPDTVFQDFFEKAGE
jgi:hypothetical protein